MQQRELSPGGLVLRHTDLQLFPELKFVYLTIHLFIILVLVVHSCFHFVVLHCIALPGSPCIYQASFRLSIMLPLPPQC